MKINTETNDEDLFVSTALDLFGDVAFASKSYYDLDDIFATPTLTTSDPFCNQNNSKQQPSKRQNLHSSNDKPKQSDIPKKRGRQEKKVVQKSTPLFKTEEKAINDSGDIEELEFKFFIDENTDLSYYNPKFKEIDAAMSEIYHVSSSATVPLNKLKQLLNDNFGCDKMKKACQIKKLIRKKNENEHVIAKFKYQNSKKYLFISNYFNVYDEKWFKYSSIRDQYPYFFHNYIKIPMEYHKEIQNMKYFSFQKLEQMTDEILEQINKK